MKILCFFPLPNRADSKLTFSGGERRFIEICNQWVKLGNEVLVVGSEYVSRLFELFGLKTNIRIYNYFIDPPIISDFLNSIRLSNSIPNGEFDFIYCPSEVFSYLVPSVLAKKKMKVPLIVSINLFNLDEIGILSSFKLNLNFIASKSLLRKLGAASLLTFETYVRNLFLRKVDLIFSVSEYTKNLLLKMGIDGERVFSVGGGIDYDHIQAIGPEEKVYKACYMGAIHSRKGVFDLVKLWEEITKREPDAKLLIMGEGDKQYVEKFKRLIQQRKLQNNVILAGFKVGEEKYRLLKQSEFFIFPSYSDSFAGAICEAMACGLPVVAYDQPAYHEFYGDGILYVKRGDVKGLTESSLLLSDDNVLRERLKEKGLEASRRFSWSGIAEYELKIISQYLKN